MDVVSSDFHRRVGHEIASLSASTRDCKGGRSPRRAASAETGVKAAISHKICHEFCRPMAAKAGFDLGTSIKGGLEPDPREILHDHGLPMCVFQGAAAAIGLSPCKPHGPISGGIDADRRREEAIPPFEAGHRRFSTREEAEMEAAAMTRRAAAGLSIRNAGSGAQRRAFAVAQTEAILK